MSTKKSVIDSYSNYALEWAKHVRSGKNIAHEYVEKPAMYAKLPKLKGKDVLAVGCGTGEECQYLKSLGANRVVGIDLSEGLIAYAKESYPELDFQVMDMEKLEFEAESFDLVYSSLVLHYVESWEATLRSVSQVLKTDGKFLFSTHHPATWGAGRTRVDGVRTSLLGYKKFKETGNFEIVGDYLNTRLINDIWFEEFEVSYFHRSLQSMMADIFGSDLKFVDYLEPKATAKCKEVSPVFWDIHQKIPIFTIFELQK